MEIPVETQHTIFFETTEVFGKLFEAEHKLTLTEFWEWSNKEEKEALVEIFEEWVLSRVGMGEDLRQMPAFCEFAHWSSADLIEQSVSRIHH